MCQPAKSFRPLFVICNLDPGKLSFKIKQIGFAELDCNWYYGIIAVEDDGIIIFGIIWVREYGTPYLEIKSFRKEDKEHIIQYVLGPQIAIQSKKRAVLFFDGKELTEEEFLILYKQWENNIIQIMRKENK